MLLFQLDFAVWGICGTFRFFAFSSSFHAFFVLISKFLNFSKSWGVRRASCNFFVLDEDQQRNNFLKLYHFLTVLTVCMSTTLEVELPRESLKMSEGGLT